MRVQTWAGRRIAILVALVGAGCALTDLTVELPAPAMGGPGDALTSAKALRIEVAPVSDERPDRGRIGVKKNLKGHETASLLAGGDLGAFLQEALGGILAQSGHRVGSERPHLRLEGRLQQFWVKPLLGSFFMEIFGSIEVKGDAKLSLDVREARTGQSLGTFPYFAQASERDYITVFDGTYEQVARATLRRLLERVRDDKKLGALLKRYCKRRVRGCGG